MKEKYRKQIISMLTQAYWMEIETVTNYLANSVDLDGVRAEEIKKALAADITEELDTRADPGEAREGAWRPGTGLDGIQAFAEIAAAARRHDRCGCRHRRRD